MQSNHYVEMIGESFFDQCPKSVFAALAVSLSIQHEKSSQHDIREALLLEWHSLHKRGLVPQKPVKLTLK